MNNHLQAPLEAIARDLGRLLKRYAREEQSATDFIGIIAAFREGYDEASDGLLELRLPLLTHDAEPGCYFEEYDHDPAAETALHLEVGPDYLEVKHRTDRAATIPSVTCFVDHGGRLTVDLWSADNASSRRHVLRDADKESS